MIENMNAAPFLSFFSHTGMIFIVIFGLSTLISMGVVAVLLDNPAIPQNGLPALVTYNFLLFAANIALTAFLYVRTYYLVTPRFFRQVFSYYNRDHVVKVWTQRFAAASHFNYFPSPADGQILLSRFGD